MPSILTTVLMVSALTSSPLVVGHRGAGVNSPENPYPENSLPSLAAAFHAGADLVEIDVQLDANGCVVLWHDSSIRFNQATRRSVRNIALDDMPPLVSHHGVQTHVPTLDEALALALHLGRGRLVMDIELKVYHPQDRARLVVSVVETVVRLNAVHRVLITSYDLEALRLVKHVLPEVETGMIAAAPMLDWSTFQRERARGLQIEWFLPRRQHRPWTIFPQQLVREARQEGVRVGVWTVNRQHHIEAFVAAGYDMIITDEPRLARQIVSGEAEPGFFEPAAEWLRESRLVPHLLLSF